MSVSNEIDRITQNIANTYAVLSALGADIPEVKTSDNLPSTAGTAKAVLYSEQNLTEDQKEQARANIGAPGVYFGDEEPTGEDHPLWVDPNGEGYDYLTSQDRAELEDQINNLSNEIVDLKESGLSLGIASDGLIYLFVDGSPVGTGIPQGTGETGDLFGYVDENNTVVLQGDLPDGTYSIKYEMENGSTVNIGNLVLDSNVYYTVKNTLTNCTSNNSATKVVQGSAYSATITAKSGYVLKTVSVTMGGNPVTISGGVINIASVTGNIVITAVAEQKQAAQPVTTNITLTDGIRIGSDGTDRSLAGYCATPHIDLKNIPKPCAIHLTKAFWCDPNKAVSTVRVHAADESGNKLINDITSQGCGGNYFTVVDNSGGTGNDVTVTVTSATVATIRFSGHWSKPGVSDSTDSFVSAGTKATLTYTPES